MDEIVVILKQTIEAKQMEVDRLVGILQMLEGKAPPKPRKAKRKLSAEGRRNIREAVKRRWAEIKKKQAKS